MVAAAPVGGEEGAVACFFPPFCFRLAVAGEPSLDVASGEFGRSFSSSSSLIGGGKDICCCFFCDFFLALAALPLAFLLSSFLSSLRFSVLFALRSGLSVSSLLLLLLL